jgi:hypothetical protein
MFKTLAIRRSATTVARRAFSVEGEAALDFTAKDALKKVAIMKCFCKL